MPIHSTTAATRVNRPIVTANAAASVTATTVSNSVGLVEYESSPHSPGSRTGKSGRMPRGP